MTDGRRADVEAHEIRGDRVALDDLARRGVGRARHHRVDGQPEIHAPRPRLLEEVAGRVDQVRLEERASDLAALGAEERERHPAADQQPVDAAEERLDQGQLVGDLGAPEDRDERARGGVEDPREGGELLLHQEPGHGRPEMPRDALRRGVGPVRGGEGVVHVDVAEPRQRPRERGIVRLLARVEAEVLQEEHAARRQRPGLALDGRADAVGGQRDGLPEERPEAARHGGERELRLRPALGAAEVRGDDHRARAPRPRVAERGQAPPGSARPRSPRRRARAGR